MTYDLTIVNASEFSSVLLALETYSGGWVSRMLILAIFVIIGSGYLTSKPDDYVGAFAVTSWVSFVLGTLMWLFNFLDAYTMGLLIGLTIVSSVALFLDRQ